ncbi:teichoic acid biosynthesis protein, partial [Staphylococcus simulans]|uniref:glycosyltransferase n=1 Tax=Staphylococcus simulans TaxID=1286 RepID=UPI000D1F51EF
MITKDKAKEIAKFITKPIEENLLNERIRLNAYYLDCIRLNKVNEQSILLESYHGVNFTGNAYALFRKLIESYPNFKCYIAIKDTEDPMIKWLKNEYKNKIFSVVEYESKKYLKLLATCKYLVNDTSYMPYFCKRKEQVYLNTWHGTPLKTLGKDIKNAGFNDHKNIQKNLFSADKLAMPNRFTAEKLIKSNDLDGILNAEIGMFGNARVDLTLNSNREAMLTKYKLVKDKKIVLFAPTWKENDSVDESVKQLIEQTDLIQKALGSDYHVYLKTHYFVYEQMLKMDYGNHMIPNWVDTNEILSTVDLLITDYSSIFFDFLPLKKPIHFFMPDKAEYEFERGMYLDLQTLPGKISNNIEELVENIQVKENEYLNSYKENIDNYLELYCSQDNGKSVANTLRFMFGEVSEEKLFKSSKKVVVFYGGGFYNNGITNSIINLSKAFNYDKYEFVIIENQLVNEEKLQNVKRLDKRVHVITKFSDTNRNIFDTISQNLLYRQGFNSNFIIKKHIKRYFELDFKRIFGNLKPDILIDYGGYNKMFTALFAFAPVKVKAIYLHANMFEEYNKKINGVYKHKWNLKVIFSLYDQFDRIVSVSETANEENKNNLSGYITNSDNKMIFIGNIIDGDEILKTAQESQDLKKHIQLYKEGHKLDYTLYDIEEVNAYSCNLKCVQSPHDNDFNFVSVGRLSPEKNHYSLIKAFKKVVEKEEKSKLFIIGDGPQYSQLYSLIQRLNLQENVFLLGFIQNPFIFVEQCDCFVLASNNEGQGMAILEANVLGKPIIGTNVSGINTVINNENGLLVENNIESIANG